MLRMKRFLSLLFCFALFFGCIACNVRQKEAQFSQDHTESVLNSQQNPQSEQGVFSLAGNGGLTSQITSATEVEQGEGGLSAKVELSSLPSVVESTDENVTIPDEVEVSNETVESLVASKVVSYPERIQSFLGWIKEEQTKDEKQPYIKTAEEEGTILIPFSKRDDLPLTGASVPDDQRFANFDFRTQVSDTLLENEFYMVTITPLTDEELKQPLEKLDSIYPVVTAKKQGKYNGIDYVYVDGYEGEDWTTSQQACAWFVQEGHLIRIWVIYEHRYEPWNTDYFDYFEFKKATL